MEEEPLPEFLTIKKTRNLSQLIKDTLKFAKDETPVLIKTLAPYSLSFILLAFIIAFVGSDTQPYLEKLFFLREKSSKLSYVSLIVSVIIFIVGYCSFTLIINTLLLLRVEGRNERARFLLPELKKVVLLKFKNYFFNFLIIYLGYYAINFVLGHFELGNFFSVEDELDLGLLNPLLNWLSRNFFSILLLPLVMYFGFSALFVSLHQEIGSSDALHKVFIFSKDHLKKIWAFSFLILAIAAIADWIITYYTQHFLIAISFNRFNTNLFFIVFTLKKMVVAFFIVFLQAAMVFLMGSVESEIKEVIDEEELNQQEDSSLLPPS